MNSDSQLRYHIVVDERLAGRTIKGILQGELKLSTRLLRNVNLRNQITKNGSNVYLNQKVILGDEIYVMLPSEESEVDPESMEVDIRYEDEEVLVVNKPPGYLTHPTAKERSGSILAGVAGYLKPEGLVPHSVHRLDRDTSGLLMFAKHAHSHHLFDLALRAGELHRTYCAIVLHQDAFEVPTVGTWATIDLPIAQDESKPARRVISATGQRAITHYRIVGQTKEASLVQIVLETGRTHQIRLHFSAVGMPLIGDKVYGSRLGGQRLHGDSTSWTNFPRQALHAHQLGWRHTVTKETKRVQAEPPGDMQGLWCDLGGDEAAWKHMLDDNSSLRLWKPV